MRPNDRRQELLEVLFQRRHDTCDNLAHEFNVSERTIRRDLEVLMCSYPLETSSGPYGGVRVASWYHPNCQSSRSTKLTPKQAELLKKLGTQLAGDDLDTLNSILRQFAP